MHQIGNFQPSFNSFVGNTRVIPNDNDITSHSSYNKASKKLRESLLPLRYEQRENISSFYFKKRKYIFTSILYQPLEFAFLRSSTFSTSVGISSKAIIPDDPATSIYKWNQCRLLSIHKRLGHLSFPVL